MYHTQKNEKMKKIIFILLALFIGTWCGQSSPRLNASNVTATKWLPFYLWDKAMPTAVPLNLASVKSMQQTNTYHTMTVHANWDRDPDPSDAAERYHGSTTPTLCVNFYGPIATYTNVNDIKDLCPSLEFIAANWPTIPSFFDPTADHYTTFGSWYSNHNYYTVAAVNGAGMQITYNANFPKFEYRPVYIYGVWMLLDISPDREAIIARYCMQKQILIPGNDDEGYNLSNEDLRVDFICPDYSTFELEINSYHD